MQFSPLDAVMFRLCVVATLGQGPGAIPSDQLCELQGMSKTFFASFPPPFGSGAYLQAGQALSPGGDALIAADEVVGKLLIPMHIQHQGHALLAHPLLHQVHLHPHSYA